MLCPWCNQEMEVGAVQSKDWIFFTRHPRSLGLGLRDGDIAIMRKGFFRRRVAAWHCGGCRRVVIDYGTEEQP